MKRILLFTLLLFLLAACSSPAAEETQAPSAKPSATSPAIARNTPAPASSVPTPSAPTSSSPVFVLYDDKAAPFTIQHPRDWKIREEPESIFFTAPDESAVLHIITYEYQEGAPKYSTAKDVLNNFVASFGQGTGLKLSQQVTNADSSISANIEYADASTRAPLQGFMRVALAKNRRYHFIVLFSARQTLFPEYKSLGTTILESFRER